MNINNYNVIELQEEDIQSIDGGLWIEIVISAAVATGAAMAWAFDKGEELGAAIAK